MISQRKVRKHAEGGSSLAAGWLCSFFAHRKSSFQRCLAAGGPTSTPCRKHAFVLNFPDVCSEPVLANGSFFK